MTYFSNAINKLSKCAVKEADPWIIFYLNGVILTMTRIYKGLLLDMNLIFQYILEFGAIKCTYVIKNAIYSIHILHLKGQLFESFMIISSLKQFERKMIR